MRTIQSILRTGIAAALALGALTATADIVVRTGVDGANAVMGAGSIDANWAISTDGGTIFNQAKVLYPAQICCNMHTVANTAAWISDPSIVDGDPATAWGVGPTVLLRHSFDLTGYDLSTVAFDGIWRVADNSLGIYLNGDLIAGTTIGFAWLTDHALNVAMGSLSFVQGLNVLEVRANSVNSSWDGLWMNGMVTGRSNGTVSAPASLGLVLLGLGLVAAQRRRRF